jgi:hypothetical protein
MFRRLRGVIESIVFAGMKPGGPAVQTQRLRWLGPFRQPVERLLSGGSAPLDPLYLTNRTFVQKARVPLLVGVPCFVAAGLIALGLNSYFVKKAPTPKYDLSLAERAAAAAKMLPDIDHIKVDTNRDVDVMEVHIDSTGGTALLGTVKNNTAHEIRAADIVFDLTDSKGSQLGGVSQRLENLAPQTRVNFRLPIEQNNAKFALVREVRTR